MARKYLDKVQAKCKLTQEEILKYGREAAQAESELNNLEAKKKSYVSQIGSDILSAKARLNSASIKVREEYEFREVECDINWDWDKKVKTWVRRDTGEVHREEIITESELQEELKLDAHAKELVEKHAESILDDAKAFKDDIEAEGGEILGGQQ